MENHFVPSKVPSHTHPWFHVLCSTEHAKKPCLFQKVKWCIFLPSLDHIFLCNSNTTQWGVLPLKKNLAGFFKKKYGFWPNLLPWTMFCFVFKRGKKRWFVFFASFLEKNHNMCVFFKLCKYVQMIICHSWSHTMCPMGIIAQLHLVNVACTITLKNSCCAPTKTCDSDGIQGRQKCVNCTPWLCRQRKIQNKGSGWYGWVGTSVGKAW